MFWKKRKTENRPLKLVVTSDWHHLSPSMHDMDEEFRRMLIQGDGKLTEYSTEIIQGILDEAVREKADAILMCGDLTYDGDAVSLLELKRMLEEVQKKGVKVFLIPGNHDTDNGFACAYRNGTSEKAQMVSHAMFMEEMKESGYAHAVSHDKNSFSYMQALNEKVWLLALDANAGAYGMVRESTMQWAEKVLAKAKRKGVMVLGMTHQNLLAQSQFMGDGFTVRNAPEIRNVFEKYDIRVNFSGHAHLQHHVCTDALTEYCTGSLTVNKECYGIVTVENNGVKYETKHLHVHEEQARKRFMDTVFFQVRHTLEDKGIPEDIMEEMTDYAARVNSAYFAEEDHLGKYREEEAWRLWQMYGQESFWYAYMCSFFSEADT